MFNDIVAAINKVLWSDQQVLIVMLLFAGVWFSVLLRFVQVRHFRHMFALLKNSRNSDAAGISSFQALCTSLSARVGTGNLAGVAIAISLGGAGAVFWMWLIAFIGMATGFAESLLGQVYKVKNNEGQFRGGPAYYIKYGLKLPWLAIIFSLCVLFGYGFIFGATQANTIADALNFAYGVELKSSGLVVTVLAAMVIVGGLRTIARFSELLVPFMGLAYVLLVVVITINNIEQVPAILSQIVSSAFGFNEAAAGTFAAALKQGIQRGLYSSEAGAGSVPQAAASASPQPNHPAVQGYLQMLGVFFDTMVLCTCTAFVVLLADVQTDGMEGIRLTQEAMTYHVGTYGVHFIAIAISLFAFTSIVANYAYAESNLHLFKCDTFWGRSVLTLTFLFMIYWGTGAELKEVWAAADMAFGLMALINIVAIILLSKTIVNVVNDYNHQQQLKRQTDFRVNQCRVQGQTAKDVWD